MFDNYDSKGNDGEHDVDDDVEDDDIDLVVSVLILNVLCNKSHGVDCFLKVRLLTQLTLSKTVAIISSQDLSMLLHGNFPISNDFRILPSKPSKSMIHQCNVFFTKCLTY